MSIVKNYVLVMLSVLNLYRTVDHGTKRGKIYTGECGKFCTVTVTYHTFPQKQT